MYRLWILLMALIATQFVLAASEAENRNLVAAESDAAVMKPSGTPKANRAPHAGPLVFIQGSAVVAHDAQMPSLQPHIAFLTSHPGWILHVQAFCYIGSDHVDNHRASVALARNIADTMIRRGVDHRQLQVRGFGDSLAPVSFPASLPARVELHYAQIYALE